MVRRCGHFFGPATLPALGFCGTASGSSNPASPSAVPRCSISDRRRACGLEAAVGELRVRASADRPGGQAAVEAVEGRGQVHLAVRKPELRDVGEPQLVGRRGPEVAVDQVLGRIGYLAFVRAVPGFLLRVRDCQPLLAHDAAHHLLGRRHRVVPPTAARA